MQVRISAQIQTQAVIIVPGNIIQFPAANIAK